MEKKTNKFFDFLLSLILPRRMKRHAEIRFVFSFLIVVLVAVLTPFTSHLRSKKDAASTFEFPSMMDSANGLVFDENVPHVSLDNSEVTGYVYENGEKVERKGQGIHLSSDKNGVFTGTKEVDGKKLVVTIVIEDQVYSSIGTIDAPAKLELFDLDGYTNQNKDENTEYILYVFTLDYVYYLIGFDQIKDGKSTKAPMNSLLYEADSSQNLIYYLPKDASELSLNDYGNIDTRKWSRTCEKDAVIDFTVPDDYKAYQSQLVPAIRHLENISNAIYGDVISYANLSDTGTNIDDLYMNFAGFQRSFKNSLIEMAASQIKLVSTIVSMAVTLLFSFILSLITWLISKNYVLRKFRQYYALVSICFSLGLLLSLILGIFMSYLQTWFYILLFETIYYIVVCFRINTINEQTDEKVEDVKEEKKPFEYEKVDNDFTQVG